MSGSLVGGVDSSIPLQASKANPQQNPLASVGEFANVLNSFNAARMVPGALKLQGQAIQSGQSSLIQQQRQLGSAALAPLLAKKGQLSLDDVTTALAGAEKSGVVTQPALQDFLSIPLTGDAAKDDASFRAHIAANSQAPENAAGQVVARPGPMVDDGPNINATTVAPAGAPNAGQLTPVGTFQKGFAPEMANTGDRTAVPILNGQAAGPGLRMGFSPTYGDTGERTSVPLLSGQQAGPGLERGFAPTGVNNGAGTQFIKPVSGQTIANQPGPSELNELKQVWNPKTQQFDYVRNSNVAPMVGGTGLPVNSVGAPVPGLPTSGRIKQPDGSAAPSTPQSYNAGASVPLGNTTPEEAKAAADHAGAARDRANSYQQTIQPVEAALHSLEGADTGRGSTALNSLHAWVQDLTPDMLKRFVPGALYGDPQERANFEEASKYLTNMAVNTPGGSRSNEGQAAAMNANASTHISNGAAKQVVQAVLAQRRLEQAGTLAFNQTTDPQTGQSLSAGQYDRFMNHWNTTQDPRAFVVDKLSPAERGKLVAGLGGVTSPAYKKFKSSYQMGLQTGVIQSPNATTGQ